jgi:hypothetical protein
MPQLPRRVELQSATILLGVDHEHPTGPDCQMINVGAAARDGQVVQDRPPVPLQRCQEAGGASLPGRPPPPGDGVRAGPESQPPASRHGGQSAEEQSEPGCQQAAKQPAGSADAKGGGHAPRKSPGPGGPLGRPHPPPPGLGGAARPAHRGPHPYRHHRLIGAGAGQQLVGVTVEVGEDGLKVGLAEGLNRSAGAAGGVMGGAPAAEGEDERPCRQGRRRLWRPASGHGPPPGRLGRAAVRAGAPSLIWVLAPGRGDKMIDGVIPRVRGRSVFLGRPRQRVTAGALREPAAAHLLGCGHRAHADRLRQPWAAERAAGAAGQGRPAPAPDRRVRPGHGGRGGPACGRSTGSRGWQKGGP